MIINDLIPSGGQFIIILTTYLINIILSFLLTRHAKFNLPQIEAFNIYPFVCRMCMIFWLNLIINIIYAYISTPYFVLWGLISASASAYMIHFSEK